MTDKNLTDVTDNNVGKMSDNEIKKALECCVKSLSSDSCNECPLNTTKECDKDLLAIEKYALDLINRLQAENERLSKITRPLIAEIKAEAYKEFCEKRGIKYVEDDV